MHFNWGFSSRSSSTHDFRTFNRRVLTHQFSIGEIFVTGLQEPHEHKFLHVHDSASIYLFAIFLYSFNKSFFKSSVSFVCFFIVFISLVVGVQIFLPFFLRRFFGTSNSLFCRMSVCLQLLLASVIKSECRLFRVNILFNGIT